MGSFCLTGGKGAFIGDYFSWRISQPVTLGAAQGCMWEWVCVHGNKGAFQSSLDSGAVLLGGSLWLSGCRTA